MSDSMRALRAGWLRVKFGDVARQVKDKVDPETSGLERYVAGDHMDTDDLRIRRWGQIGSGYLGPAFHMRFQPGQVLYGSRRTYLRKVAVADFTGICANTTFVIETRDSTVLLPEYLPFVMQTEMFHAHSIKQSKGSVNPYINFVDLTWFEFLLPPLEEQLRIATLLLEIDEVADSYWKLATSAERATSSLALDQLCVRGLDPYRGFSDCVPNGWRLTQGDEIYAPQSGNGEPEVFDPNGDCIFLKVSDLNLNDEMSIDHGEARYFSQSFPSLKVFSPGTVVFPKRGASIFLNKVGILRVPAALDPNLMALTLRASANVSSEYLYWLIKAIGLHRMADVTSVPQLNHKHMSPLRFALPSQAKRKAVVANLAAMRAAWKDALNRRNHALKLKTRVVGKEFG